MNCLNAYGSNSTTSRHRLKVGITLKESATYVDFANINTGGVTPDGKDGVNAVSYSFSFLSRIMVFWIKPVWDM